MSDEDVDLDLLRASARDFLSERGDKESVEDLAAMDWTALLVDESMGGVGWRPVETCVVAEELGRAQDRSAWFGTTLAAAAIAAAPDEVRDGWLPRLMAGTATAGFTIADDSARVIRGDEVDVLVTVGRNGIHIIADLDGRRTRLDDDLLDVTRPVWRVALAGAPSTLIGSAERSDQLLGVARLLIAADSVGAVSMTLERLTAYLKERIAFGRPVAGFQAIQHRLVDLLVLEAKARAIVMKAARAIAAADDGATALTTAAHAFVAAKATAAVDECMQLSGGIGFTWEYPLHYELRRVFTNGHLIGTVRSSRALFAEVSGW
ncbi:MULTISPECIES: acyl-CoA dehydrogenase family protein [unclassified Mycobacterium]|uniref:acyl-CoA dehydrogenase family protein n=1 Tax=unclassified Mycobacterium TaxID=2642494 RepID=UPI00073FE142|nr:MULTISPECIES: acyl-CoA dehydrogenase family protein [unclassified Mycobacterium]KUH82927.1 acyl-CoA dehydrogenase [Mycobacterium sp. IS-1556]KUH83294.1 acyl-CoA dehydrogenase [Mycobacterium sp. GA-0227b]KUH84296.1 acyl-CoA dehydrogenase [Mycobacterium sp. GA-1999]